MKIVQIHTAVTAIALVFFGAAYAQTVPAPAELSAAQSARADGSAKIATILKDWPAGIISTQRVPGAWAYEEGVFLDNMAAEYELTGDPVTLAYIRATVDRWAAPSGTVSQAPDKALMVNRHVSALVRV